MALLLKVKNTGAPSSIDEIRLRLVLNSGRAIEVSGVQPPKDGLYIKDKNGIKTGLPESKNLVSQGLLPIPTGGVIEGYLLGAVKDVRWSEASKLPLWVEISFDDAKGKRIVTKLQSSGAEAEVFDAYTIKEQIDKENQK